MRKAADMIAAANDIITVVTAEDAIAMHEKGEVSFIDIREMPELDANGKIPGAHRVPRAMLEFFVDPSSPFYKEDIFPQEGKMFCFY
ncbi:MAG: rhodanese-like domain-containing protein [Chloroflexota bacterium]